MRSFIILGFLAAVASAGVLPGYQYGPGVSGVRQETVIVGSGLSGAGSLNGHGSSYNTVASSGIAGGYSAGGHIGSGIVNSGSGLGYGSSASGIYNNGAYKQSASSGTTLDIGIDALDSIPQTVEYSKQFYHFTAPEEAHEEGRITKQLSNILKKNLQVVFIKAPENNAATNAALQLAKQAIEQKTAIYVLSKQNDGTQLIGQLQQIQENVQTAPEVRFVKYRTAEDVERAKASIQSQYNNFGGASETYNGGVAPVLNYASAAQPKKIVFGGSKIGSSQIIPSGNSYGSGSSIGSTQLIGAGSSFGSGASSGSYQLIASGSGSGSGLGFGSGSGSSSGSGSLLGSGLVSTSGSGSGSGSGSSFNSGSESIQFIGLGSLNGGSSSSSSSGSSGSGSGSIFNSASGSTQSIELGSYLPPLPLKK